MKLVVSSLTMMVLLVGLTTPVLAQNPAVRMTQEPTKKQCIKAELKNLNTASALAVTDVALAVFEQKTCKRLCVFRTTINKKIEPCQSLSLEICCPNELPGASGYIYWLRVRGSTGLLTEDWLFTP
jgi:hypothetical protein